MKTCTRCKIEKERTEFYQLKGKQYKPSWDVRDSHCIPCRTIYQSDRRRNIKKMAVEYKGGCCVDCGFKTEIYSVYDFHHLDETQKDFTIAANVKTLEKLKPELDKCVLLCANCHRIRHS